MAAPKQAPEPPAPKEPDPPATAAADDGLVEKVTTAVKEVLGALLDSGELTVKDQTEEPEKKTDKKPESPREAESRMEDIVAEAVKALKLADKEAEPAKAEPKHEPETVPGPKGWREKLWGDK